MKSAGIAQHFQSRTQIEVIGISEDDLGLDLLAQFGKVNPLHATHRSDRHENRCLDLAVVGGYNTGTGIAGLITMLNFERHSFFSLSSSSGMVKSSGFFTISSVRANCHTSCTLST